MEVGAEGDYYTYRYTVTPQNDSCIKMGSDESHFNVSLIVRDKATVTNKTVSVRRPQFFEDKGEPKRIRTEIPLLTSLTPYGR